MLGTYIMTSCPNCGKENSQSGAIYCSFCSSSLQKEEAIIGAGSPATEKTIVQSEIDLKRLEKATRKVELLGYIVAAEAVGLLVLLLFLYFTFYG
jgi:hypothetical protein